MIAFRPIDIFAEPADAVVIPVNCVGVMGAGAARVAARRWGPQLVESYKLACADGMSPGRVWAWRARDRWVLLAPTKRHWRNHSNFRDVEATVHALSHRVAELGCRVVACPALGCGLGGLAWDPVRELMKSAWGDLPEKYVVSPPR